MGDGSAEETVVVRYLLGDLPEETLIQVEDRAFSDPEYLRVIEAVEADLIDAYVHNQLRAEERRQFESRFLASAERRRKLEFAQVWARVADEAKTAAQKSQAADRARPRRSWRERFALLIGPAPAFRYTMAAVALLLISVVSWQALQSSRLRNRVNELEAERSRQQQREQSLKTSLEAERARADQLNSRIRGGSSPALMASLTLGPGSLRDATARPEIRITPNAEIARLEIQLEPKDKYPHYRAELRTQRGDDVLTRNNLREHQGDAGRSVVLAIPVESLSTGDYELTLVGLAPGKRGEDIGYYRFSVTKP